MRHHDSGHRHTRPRGKALVMFVLFTPILLGLVGLTVDGGLMLVVHRQTQNAADAAALAAALDLKNGRSSSAARATGTTYGQSYYNMPDAPTLNIPPSSGPHSTGSTNGNYA
jgi:Flp pilus assembly protein TadG